MAVHPVKCTMPSVPCAGLTLDDTEITAEWGTGANVGRLIKGTDNGEIAGKVITVEKGDGITNSVSGFCTLEYAGVIRFPVKDSVTLSTADKGKKALCGADGTAKPVDFPAPLDPSNSLNPTDAEFAAYNTRLNNYHKKAKGRIVDFSNKTGDKWIDVAGYFG